MNHRKSSHFLWLSISILSPLFIKAQTITNYQPLNTQYPISIRKGTVCMGQRQWTLNAHTLLVDQQLTNEQCATSPYLYNSFLQAAAHLPDGTASAPMTLLIAPGVYWIDDPDEPAIRQGTNGQPPFGMTIRCSNLHLIGLTDDPHHVVLASQRGQTQGAIGNFTMIDFHTDSLFVSNLTMGNYCNVDLDYPLCPKLSRPRRSDVITQAQLAFCHGEWTEAHNCRFVSRLNLCPIVGSKDAHYTDCHFESTDDALNGSAVYTHCDFDFYAPKPLWSTSGYGAVFIDCDFHIRHNSHEQYFCKHPGQVTVINSRFHALEDTYIGWTPDAPRWLRNAQSATTLNGHPLLIGHHQSTNTLQYDLLHVPMGLIGEQVLLNHHQAVLRTGTDSLLLEGQLLNRQAFDSENDISHWSVEPGYESHVSLAPRSSNTCLVTPTHEGEEAVTCCVIATTSAGLEAACEITVLPRELPSPRFSRYPRLSINNGVVHLGYELELEGRADESDITWLRTDPTTGREVTIAVSDKERPERSYQLTAADVGKQLTAVIRPKSPRSTYGTALHTAPTKTIKEKNIHTTDVWETDFHNFPCANQLEIRDGEWTIDGHKPADTNEYPWTVDPQRSYWHYGTGINGCRGKGLLQNAQGARLLYTPLPGHYGNMEIELLCDPSKTAGQGFSSALGQYMDLYIKYDTRTLSGYGLRIIRTTKYANAVDFLLMRFDNDVATPLTSPVSTTCYRTGCTIRLSYRDGLLTATASTTTPQPDSSLAKEVSLRATVQENPFGGIGIQHTGTTGEGTTMLHRLRVTMK